MRLNFLTSMALPLWLACGAAGLVSACQPSEEVAEIRQMSEDRKDDVKVVRVGETYIYASDINRAAVQQGIIDDEESLPEDHPRFQVIVDSLVDQRLLANEANRQGFDKDPAVRRRVALARERLLSGVAVERHIEKTVTEAAARELYNEQVVMRPRGEEVKASHILLETEEEAGAVIARLEKGETFAALATELSIDPSSRVNSGDLGYFTKEAMVEPFAEAAFALETGEISAPVQTQFGWHVIRAEDRRTPAVPSFEDMREDIFNYLTYSEIEKFKVRLRVDGDIERVSNDPPALETNDDGSVDDVPGEAPEDEETP